MLYSYDTYFLELIQFFIRAEIPFYGTRVEEIQTSILGELGAIPNYNPKDSYTLLNSTSEVFEVQKCIAPLGFHLERRPDKDNTCNTAYSIVPNWK